MQSLNHRLQSAGRLTAEGGTTALDSFILITGIAGAVIIGTVPIVNCWADRIMEYLWILAFAARFRHYLRPILERLMAEKQNVVVMPQLSAEQIERLLWKLNHRKYPRHVEIAEKRVAELRRERRAA